MMKFRATFIYVQPTIACRSQMIRIYRATLLVLYQLTLLVGIALMPVAMLVRRVGVTLPIHRAVERLGDKYEKAATA
ncbi:MAG: hypothetical protein ACI8XM_002525 [Haloarculaceae archaeon]|jgi:hypothetical protein